MKYNPSKIEKKWQKYWEAKKFYNTKDKGSGDNYMLLTEFPYTSGNLHMGHWYAYAPPDMLARYLRMSGYNVLYPIGFDAFGLPAENAAIQRNISPNSWTEENIKYMTKQLKSIGAVFDWSREVKTNDPQYYKWTQWIFLKMYEKGLAYRASTPVNWCPKDKTVLANEQVIDGKCDRCGTEVVQKELSQWMFRISKYADRLIDDMEGLDWPETTKLAQKNWIGRSEGAKIKFYLSDVPGQEDKKPMPAGRQDYVEVFTTRPDTIFGATFIVVSPELTKKWIDVGWQAPEEVRGYIKNSLVKRELERQEAKEKTGVSTGIFAINPANDEKIPVWVADYVLGHYGTGAIMAVPAHDQRDFEFAKKFGLPIKAVINSNSEASAKFINRSLVSDWKEKVSDKYKYILTSEFVEFSVLNSDIDSFISFGQNLLKDGPYYFSLRGDTKLIVYKNRVFDIFQAKQDDEAKIYGREHKIPEPELGWSTVYIEDGQLINSGKFNGLLSAEARKKITVELKSKGLGEFQKTYRLHDWILSRQRYWGVPIPMTNCLKCGYQPVNEMELPIKLPPLKNFKPADDGRSPLAKSGKWLKTECLKCGGDAERETDTMDTFVDSSWYFIRYTDPKNKNKLANHDKIKKWLPAPLYIGGSDHNTMHLLYSRFFTKVLYDFGLVPFSEPFLRRVNRGWVLGPNHQKMSKSKGNVIDPDIEVKKFGADTVRMYLAFMGPFEQGGSWDLKGINGVFRFLSRVWNYVGRYDAKVKLNPEAVKILNKFIKEIGNDIKNLKFNTGVSGLMKLLNELESHEISKGEYETLLKLLAPFAPHLAEELWRNVLKNKSSIHLERWPEYDEKLLFEEKVRLVVQVNGKVRDTLEVIRGLSEDDARRLALASENVKRHVTSEIKKTIYVKDRIINLVL